MFGAQLNQGDQGCHQPIEIIGSCLSNPCADAAPHFVLRVIVIAAFMQGRTAELHV